MAIFPHLEVESVVQVNDRTRLDASRTIVTPDEAAITKIEIKPSANDGFIDVTDDKYLDWQYSSAGDVTVTVQVTTDGAPESKTATITVVTEATDNLFSSDADLVALEPKIMNYVREGRTTFKDIHREAQKQILDWFDSQGIRDKNGVRLTAAAVVDVQEVKEWSKHLVLQLIFEGLSNATDDVFSVKAERYRGKAIAARNRAQVKLDLDGDGDADTDERTWIASVNVVRR